MKPIYTLDAETDPFMYGRKPIPFAWGLWRISSWRNEGVFECTWGKNCTEEMINRLYELEPGIVYMHNGGRFDVFYMLYAILAAKKQLQIVNSRIIKCYIPCRGGYHEIRDSYKIFGQKLSEFKKTDIDYNKFESNVREQHKEEILSYLKDDCRFLYTICSKFIEQFGKAHLTIGTCAVTEMKKFYDMGDSFDIETDAEIRHPYYYGARVQCLEKGIIKHNKITVLDVNSMYPYAMANFQHPIGFPTYSCNVTDDTYFVTLEGTNKNALPFRQDNGEVTFEQEYGIFHCSIYEYITACELGLFKGKVLEAVNFKESLKFDAYVNHFYALRQQATKDMETKEKYSDAWFDAKLIREFNKLLLNNSYGKAAINPENYLEYDVTEVGDTRANMEHMSLTCSGNCPIIGTRKREYACGGWHMDTMHEAGYKLWKKPSNRVKLNNVATGASVTGAGRSVLLRGLYSVERALYCDTDSIICAGSNELDIDASKLGAWKLEEEGDEVAICGKKLYAVFDKGVATDKYASKGVKITPDQIRSIANGAEIDWHNDAPTFNLSGGFNFIHRTVRMT